VKSKRYSSRSPKRVEGKKYSSNNRQHSDERLWYDDDEDELGDLEVDDTAWQALVEGPAHEAGVFYNQIQDEIKSLRQRVDTKLKDMISVGNNDVEALNRQVTEMKNKQSSSDSDDLLPPAAEVGAGIFSENLTGLATQRWLETSREKNKKKKPTKKSQQKRGDRNFESLRVSESAATEPMTNLTKTTVPKRLHKINFPEDRRSPQRHNEAEYYSSEEDQEGLQATPRTRLRPQRRRKSKSPSKRQQQSMLFSPNDAVTKARNVDRDDAITDARFGRASPPRRRFFPEDEEAVSRRRKVTPERDPPDVSVSSPRNIGPVAPGRSRHIASFAEDEGSAALVPVESTRSPYADEIRDKAMASFANTTTSLNRTGSDLRRSIGTGAIPAKMNEVINLSGDAPSEDGNNEYPEPSPSPNSRKKPSVPPIKLVNEQTYSKSSIRQNAMSNAASKDKRLDLLMASLDYLDNKLQPGAGDEIEENDPIPRKKSSSSSNERGKVSTKTPKKRGGKLGRTNTRHDDSSTSSRSNDKNRRQHKYYDEEKKEEEEDLIDWDDHQSYASEAIATKTSNLQSLAQSSVTNSVALMSTEPSSEMLMEIEREVGFNEGFVKVEKVQCRSIVDPYGDRGRYSGLLVKGRPYGHGSMHYDDGRSYTGDWKNGRWHGKGRTLFVNGDFFVGDYIQDQRHGLGRYEWSDGRVYDGSFKQDRREGKGTYTWPDGAIYSGDFKNGHRHGQGCYKFKDGSVYTGEFKEGKYDGVGECVWSDGRCYRGEWYKGHAHGYGVEVRPDGTIRHEGEWKKDRPIRDEKTRKEMEAKKDEMKQKKKKQSMMPENPRQPKEVNPREKSIVDDPKPRRRNNHNSGFLPVTSPRVQRSSFGRQTLDP